MRKIIQIAKWFWSWYSYNFAGINYTKYHCEGEVDCHWHGITQCGRMKHHLGDCICGEVCDIYDDIKEELK